MTVEWELDGQRFVGIDGGPQFPSTEAVSFLISCADQAEVDHCWVALTPAVVGRRRLDVAALRAAADGVAVG